MNKFITFEGGEGSGKSTQSKMLYDFLIKNNIDAIHTREVGGTKEAEQIRNLLVNSDLLNLSELMLVMAARCEHINKVIIPALIENKWVICDRFIDSTIAYQKCDGLTIEKILQINDFVIKESLDKFDNVIDDLYPTYTFWFDLEPDVAIQRAKSRGDNNKYDLKEMEFHYQVYDNFLELSQLYMERIHRVYCQYFTEEQIHHQVLAILDL